MKKLILAVAIVASGLSTFALTVNPIQTEISTVSITEDFKEVALENVPTAVTDAVAKDLSTATLNKAYVNSSEQYKLEITMDGTDNVVYADKDGNWLQAKDVEATQETME
ncbi:hypothetical protein [Algibacter lectus]|uniref:Beta-lactamase-inhibitor-like PepSY-like domain-containing protein n=1 Tax=Algibacter lectus TaxID=221126 RepID=A0A090VE24_9FLAO|nr:hypothetical protein [Algibacter lectus]MWW24387.1 hypothetical protein [Algibacter lectus]TDY62406.1 hypothetical protein DFQ06_2244 [Algibacter lectus]SFC65983.1 hypothetical protein SAMN04489722_10394 [Algibacter lectus]GAL62328.1 hypothetical protein JCM19300_3079 [Algibacter lectus]GAL78627.1 hypothetical protein JCM19274_1091 [Algibacter lectus]